MGPAPQSGIPPGNFNLTGFVFRPNLPYQPRPGLQDSTEKLHREGRLRSALESLLAILAESPHDQEALTLALVLVGGTRTEQLRATEPLSPKYLLDRRLDPIFAVCSHCRNTSWVPQSCLFGDAAMVANPAGLQCRSCGYVVCRKCYMGMRNCPNCQADALRAPVYPTGREPRQLARRAQPVVAAIVLREGPIPPDREWLTTLFDTISPDVMEHNVRLSAYPMHPWPRDIQGIALAVAARMIREGKLGAARLEGMIHGEVKSQDGLRAYVLKLYA